MNRLKELRTRAGLSIRQLGEATGINYSNLSRLELNKNTGFNLKMLNKLCTYFNCTPNYLLGYEEVKEPCKAISVPQESQRIIELERRIYELEQTVIRQAIELTKK